MAIAADRQTRGGPVVTGTPHQAANVAADFLSGRRLAGPQQDADRPRGGDVRHGVAELAHRQDLDEWWSKAAIGHVFTRHFTLPRRFYLVGKQGSRRKAA
jgi:hypothetical protein